MDVIAALPIMLLLGLVGIAGWPTLVGLLDLWSGRDDYSHGYLVPVISAYLVWHSRETLFRLPLEPAWWSGVALLGVSGLALVFAQWGGLVTVGGVAFVGVLLGAVLLVAGVEWSRCLLLPIGYLLLCVPVLDSLIAPLHWPFQLMTAEMSTKALRMLGVPAFLEGNYIAIPEVTMEVATQCSGASLLIAVVAIGIPLAYVNLRLWWTRVGLLLFGIVVAVLANWARVTVIGLYAHMGGKEFHGPMHIFQGLSVAWVGFIGIFVGAWLLGRFEERRGVALVGSVAGTMWSDYRLSAAQRLRAQQAGWTGVVVAVVLAGLTYGATPSPAPLQQELTLFPYEIGAWRGERVGSDTAFFQVQGADAELVRDYGLPSGGRHIQLYVAYFAVQEQGREIVNDQTGHLHQAAERIALLPEGGPMANIGRVARKDVPREVVFWYEDGGRVNADRRWSKLSMIANRLLAGRTNGALVVISAPAVELADTADAKRDVEEFARRAYPMLREFLP